MSPRDIERAANLIDDCLTDSRNAVLENDWDGATFHANEAANIASQLERDIEDHWEELK